MSNIHPSVAAAIERRAQALGRQTPSLASPDVEQETPAAPAVEEPEAEPIVVENDNPPEPPEGKVYHYQTEVVITPERAQALLDLNAKNNRRKKETKIIQYARDMRKGYWKSKTGEAVKIADDGEMIDGQNRMESVIRANRAVVFDIAWNCPKDVMGVIDAGAPRTVADDFVISGVAERFLGGALVRWAIAWERSNYMNRGGRMSSTRSEVRERYLQEPHSFDQAAMFGKATHKQIGSVNESAAAMAYWLFSKLDQEAAERFFDSFIGGLDLNAANPATAAIAALRNKMVASRTRDLDRVEQLVLFIKAWNAFRSGRLGSASGRLNVPARGSLTVENFPIPR